MTKDFHYSGFRSPNYTQVPDDVFDVIAPELTEAELRVLLYIVRRTFGFKRQSDAISLTQMVDGIRTRDGRTLDRGTGMSRRGVMKGCAGLVEKGIITVERRLSEQGDNEINIYSLRFIDDRGVGNVVPYGREPSTPGVGNEVAPQETVIQQTDFDSSNIRKGSVDVNLGDEGSAESERLLRDGEQRRKANETGSDTTSLGEIVGARYGGRGRPPRDYSDDRQAILEFIQDFATYLGDQAPLQSSVTRAMNLYRKSGLSRAVFIEALYQARAITQERSGSINAEMTGGGPFPRKKKMAYFFSVLEDRLGLKEAKSDRS